MAENAGCDMCPLCGGRHVSFFWEDNRRVYWHCQTCELIFVPKAWHITPGQEKAYYDLHQNSPEDTGYRRFLNRLYLPLREKLLHIQQAADLPLQGLDFGCGPGPTLSVMFEEAGLSMNTYDVFYQPRANVLDKCYDFITATEVVEHLSEPGRELLRLWRLLKPGGWLGIMTKQWTTAETFRAWHYKNDLTHISFFNRQSFRYLGDSFNTSPVFIGDDVVLFQKH